MNIEIEGVDKTSICRVHQTDIHNKLNSRNTFAFTLYSSDGSYRPLIGYDVVVTHSGSTIFGGTIDDITEYSPNNGISSALMFDCSCVDYNQLADRFLVAEEYEDDTAGDIIKDIIDNFINTVSPGEGVTYTNVEDGPTVSKAIFDYLPASQCFDELSELSGNYWNIDYDKDMHFQSHWTNIAPFSLTDSSGNYRNMVVRCNRGDYRNKQYFRGGRGVSASRTNSFKGDGETQTFSLKLPCAKVPSAVKVDDVSKTIGIRQLDTGKDWYWSKGEREITQDAEAEALTSDNTLAVTYQGLYPIIGEALQDSAILDRKTVEGGTGIYESIVIDESIDTEDAVKERTEALLRKYGEIPEIVEFETDTDGLQAGQLIPIENTIHNLDGDYLIDQVTTKDITSDVLKYNVVCLSGESIGGWVNFFKALAKRGQSYTIRENEVLIKIKKFSEDITITDSLTVSDAAPENRIGYATIGFSEVG